MVSKTHEDGPIVESKETTPISALPKNEEQMKLFVQHDNENFKNKGVEAENLSSANASEEEMNICDTCGDLGDKDSLVICSKCKVGAEHTYCMMLKIIDPPNEWYCYDCTKDKEGLRKGEEISSMKIKDESFIDFFKIDERALSQQQSESLNASASVVVDLNTDLNFDLNVDPNSRKRKSESFIDFFKMSEQASSQADSTPQNCYRILGLDLNKVPNLDLNAEPNTDMNAKPNIDLNVDFNIDLNVNPDINVNIGSNLNL